MEHQSQLMELLLGLIFIGISLVVIIFWLFKNLEKKLLSYFSDDLQKKQEDTIKQALKEESQSHREEFHRNSKALREEVNDSILKNTDSLRTSLEEKLTDLINQNKKDQSSLRTEVFNQLDKVSSSVNQNNMELRNVVDQKMNQLTEQNKKDQEALKVEVSKQLDQVRETVNEKLQGTLEKRLQTAFSQVDEKLVQLHRGLGEIQNLSGNVKGLTKLMSNVKSRGVWGEFQLGRILEDIFTPHQYSKNAQVKKGSKERVEYAVKMPGKSENKDDCVLLPIDAKFPLEDYQRLVEAQEDNQTENIDLYRGKLKEIIKKEAQSISTKYINPPTTTDFAILFLPTESLYAEVLSQAGFNEDMHKQYKVLIAGPTTLTALLLSLSVGFQTLAIEKKSVEVSKLLTAVKSYFGKFVTLLEKTEKKVLSASQELGKATDQSKKIQHKLEGMHQIKQVSNQEASEILQLPSTHFDNKDI